MVYFSLQARADLQEIFDALLAWETKNRQPILTYEMVVGYHNSILDVCENLDKLSYHRKSRYKIHKQHGDYIYQYKRNSRTSWYVIYAKRGANLYIQRIMSNYRTI